MNPFNLADDLMEPYRPLVDLFTASQNLDAMPEDTLTVPLKRQLFNLTNHLVLQKEKRLRVMTSSDRCAASLAASIEAGENRLELPQLLPLEEGRYE